LNEVNDDGKETEQKDSGVLILGSMMGKI